MLEVVEVTSGEASLRELKDGNARYALGNTLSPNLGRSRRAELAAGQAPFAMVFSCVDSRVPPEVVFDRGLGDLLVIRTAGQAIDGAAMGSIEFGAGELGIPLVVVLGHEKCGAVSATIEAVKSGAEALGSIGVLVDSISPALRGAVGEGDELVDAVVRANIANVVARLEEESPVLAELVEKGELVIAGARYDLESGVVDFIA